MSRSLRSISADNFSSSGWRTDIKVAIQGYEGSFHQMAAQHYFGRSVQVLPCDTFKEVVTLASDADRSNGGIMAIENSIAGSIISNYNLLRKSDVSITGEVFLQVNQNLLVNPGVKLEDIREVHSHRMAILQCLKFLDQYDWKIVETDDTALSARNIHRDGSKHIAAIASTYAAELYGLDVLAPDIQTLKNNYTRFLILERDANISPKNNVNKASLNFHVGHEIDSLAKLLSKIAECGVVLAKLQSFPIPDSVWKYFFYADLEFENADHFYSMIEAVKPLTREIELFGLYNKGLTIDK